MDYGHLVTGSDGQIRFALSEIPDTATISLKDAAGTAVTIGATDYTTATVTAAVGDDKVPATLVPQGGSVIGPTWEAACSWSKDGQTRRDIMRIRIVADDGDYSYVEHLERGYSVPEADFDAAMASARRIVAGVTRFVDTTALSAADAEAVLDATHLAAEAVYAAETGVIGEKLGSYSVTYGYSSPTKADAAQLVIGALSGTGLAYRGLLR